MFLQNSMNRIKISCVWLICIFSCAIKDNDFQKYSEQLSTIKTPVSFQAMKFPEELISKNYDPELFKKFKFSSAYEAYGKIYEDDKIVCIIYTVVGDMNVPVIVTYDKQGNKIDSLNLFEKASGFDFDKETFVYITLSPD